MNSGRMNKKCVDKIVAEFKQNIDKLVELYYETDPQKGKKSEKDKYFKARQAIHLATHHISFLTQWAESHIIGYHQSGSENPDKHEYEELDTHDNTEAYRAAIADILVSSIPAHSSGYKAPSYHDWREILSDSLHALNKGETFPITAPKLHKKEPNKYTMDRLRVAAVLHVYRETEKLGKKEVALDYVAGKINLSSHTIRDWEKALLDKSDREKFKKAYANGYKLSVERKRELDTLESQLNSEEFATAQRDFYKKSHLDLSRNDMLLWEFPLESLAERIRSAKSSG